MTLALSHPPLSPFFAPQHDALAAWLQGLDWEPLRACHDPAEAAQLMGRIGLYRHLVPSGTGEALDVRGLVLIREALAQVSPLADSIFAVQGLGSFPIQLAGTPAQRAWLVEVASGARIAAFALTEPEAGSDVGAIQTTATRDAQGWVLSGEKVFISNAGIADHYIVFANADPAKGSKGITAFIVPKDAPGLSISPIPMSVPHPLGRLRFEQCRLPEAALLGVIGGGMKLALTTLDTFRISVGAAANGMASRALALAVAHVRKRRQFGAALAEQQIVRAYLAEMTTDLEAGRLLVARAAHARDTRGRASQEAAMAKLFATEAAQKIIDRAVQLHGGLGVVEGEVERLYREIRPLRIYEGTTEIQKLIIARHVLDAAAVDA